MQLKDREIAAIARRIREAVQEIQKERQAQMAEDYKNSSQFATQLGKLIGFVKTIAEKNKLLPDTLKADGIRFNEFYVHLNDHMVEDCRDLLMVNFYKEHPLCAIDYYGIEDEIILSSIENKNLETMIQAITKKFSEKELIK